MADADRSDHNHECVGNDFDVHVVGTSDSLAVEPDRRESIEFEVDDAEPRHTDGGMRHVGAEREPRASLAAVAE